MDNERSTGSSLSPNHLRRYGGILLLAAALLCANRLTAQEADEIFQQRVTIPTHKTTVFNALNQLSDSTGFLFAYNSQEVKSDKTIRPNIINLPLRDAIFQILGDTLFSLRLIDRHILIYKKTPLPAETTSSEPSGAAEFLNIKGRILDAQTRRPLAYATIGLPLYGVGTVTNQDGFFFLKIPSRLKDNRLTISYLGYESKAILPDVLSPKNIDIYLEPSFISIQEVIIRNIDPELIVKEAVAKIPDNFNAKPTYYTAFYREGVVMNKKYQNYSEAVFRIYKPSYSSSFDNNQVKLIKSRKFTNVEQTDTLSIKLKGGVNSALMLDIAKTLPDFLDAETQGTYIFKRNDIVTVGGRTAYEISFEQRPHITKPLLKGVIIIDMENLAILGARFEVNPKHLASSANMFLVKRNRNITLKPQSVSYSVNFSRNDEGYHLNHVRGDLHFKYRKRRSLLYNPFHTFLELVVTRVESDNVRRFAKKETMKTSSVFADTRFEYDEQFWGDFNIIAPEQSIFDALQTIETKIEQISMEGENSELPPATDNYENQ
jgi:hypothetical protein